MKYLMPLCVFLILCVPLHAEKIQPTRFAYGMTLKLLGDGAIYSLTLPDDVYHHTTGTDLGDIRIFNGANEVVPHAITQSLYEKSSQPDPVSLPFFPLFTSTKNDKESLSMKVKTSDAGTIIDVNTGDKVKEKAARAYLFDLSDHDALPKELLMKWTKREEDILINNISIAGSNDLKYWQTVNTQATLAELGYLGYKLKKNTINLTGSPKKYLRMTWPEKAGPLNLIEVFALFAEKEQAQPRRWHSVSGTSVMDKSKKVYLFETEKNIPVDRLNVQLAERNSLLQAILKSRPNKDKEWTVRGRGLFYNLNFDGTNLKNEPISLSPTTNRYWMLEATADSSGLGKEVPQLKFGWLPHRLIFLARGKAPFKLAYGSANILPPKYTVNNLLDKIDEKQKATIIKTAMVGPKLVLGGESRLYPSPPEIPWKQYVLWGVLIAGVFILGLMAWRLYRQMNH
jgi:hypothetical protein